MTILCSFIHDYARACERTMVAFGFSVPTGLSPERIIMADEGLRLRLLPMLAYRVHESRELRDRARRLSPAMRNMLARIHRDARNGVDLSAYFSRRLFKAAFVDHLLAHWNITHLHMGKHPNRTDAGKTLLFVWRDGRELYFIDLGTHEDFVDQRLLLILKHNWPHLLAPYAVNESLCGADLESTAAQRTELRKRVVSPITVDGIVYLPPGLGVATDGTPIRAVDSADRILSFLSELERRCQKSEREIRSCFRYALPARMSLELETRPTLETHHPPIVHIVSTPFSFALEGEGLTIRPLIGENAVHAAMQEGLDVFSYRVPPPSTSPSVTKRASRR